MFKKVLIANRGEIAIRVINTCKRMGVLTVGIYTPSDKHCKHVSLADKSVELRTDGNSIGYLDIDAIIDVANRMKVDAIHPGYGFLSEKPEFSERCEEEGIAFLGPSHRAMRLLGGKLSAREFMSKVGVPIMPGTLEPLETPEEAIRQANKIGYPVLDRKSVV